MHEHFAEQEQATLADLLLAETAEPTPGWRLLVRYVDTLCPLHQIRRVDYGLQYEDGSLRDVSDGKVVARGAKSMMLELPGCANTFKVSCLALLHYRPGHSCLPHCKYMANLMQVAPLDRIHQDCSMHILVDKVRRTVQALFSTCTLVDCTTPACQGEGIRRMVRGGRGSTAGVEGLGFIELEGHAEPVGILTESREVAAACTALQEVG